MKPYNGYSGKERQRAFDIQNEAIRSGVLSLAITCRMCGQINYMTAHLENYDYPLEPYSLCIECHMNVHLRFEHPLGWISFLKRLREGYKPQNYLTVKQYFKSEAAVEIFKTKGKEPGEFTADENKWFEMLALTPVNHPRINNIHKVTY